MLPGDLITLMVSMMPSGKRGILQHALGVQNQVNDASELKNDRRAVLAAVTQNGRALEYASAALQKDIE